MPKARSQTSLEKGLEILNLFKLMRSELSAKEIASLLTIPLSTVYRYLGILLDNGFLSRDASGNRIILGPVIFKLAHAAYSRTSLIDTASPEMSRLTVNSGESSFLYVVRNFDAICIHKTETENSIRMSVPLGSSLPLHAGASAKIMLAYKDEEFLEHLVRIRGLPRLTENTVTSFEKLKKELAEIRRQGYAVSNSEAALGASAIAAPIKEMELRVVAGLSIGGPSERIHGNVIHSLAKMVVKSALKISQDLGYRQASN